MQPKICTESQMAQKGEGISEGLSGIQDQDSHHTTLNKCCSIRTVLNLNMENY